jgi:uncharacterized FAD-dependent dehydrogenase
MVRVAGKTGRVWVVEIVVGVGVILGGMAVVVGVRLENAGAVREPIVSLSLATPFMTEAVAGVSRLRTGIGDTALMAKK